MKNVLYGLLCVFAIVMLPAPVSGQVDGMKEGSETRETTYTYTVLTTDGYTLGGMFVRWSGDTLVLRAQDTTLHRIRRGNIARVKERSTFEEVEKQDAATAFGISERGNKETRCGEERKWYI